MKKQSIEIITNDTINKVPSLIKLMYRVRENPNILARDYYKIRRNNSQTIVRTAGKIALKYFAPYTHNDFNWLQIMEALNRVPRWSNYRDNIERETSLIHTLRDIYLIETISEKAEGYITTKECAKPDNIFLKQAFLLHDIGEIGQGDILYKDKKIDHETGEFDYFLALFRDAPAGLAIWLLNCYLLQYVADGNNKNTTRFKNYPMLLEILSFLNSGALLEGLIFKAAERLGYVLYGLYGLVEKKYLPGIVQILRNQHPHLKTYANSQQIPGFNQHFYTQEVIAWVEELLHTFEGQFEEK